MDIGVRIDDAQLKRALRALKSELTNTRPINERVARAMRDYVKDTIRMGGRNRAHAPLAPMTIARTGRTKPLVGVEKGIRASATKDEAVVYHTNPKYTATQHHRGYTTPAINKSVLMKSGDQFFRGKKASRVPAREIWPNIHETYRVVKGLFSDWIKSGAFRAWR